MHGSIRFAVFVALLLSAAPLSAQSLRGSRSSVELMYRQALSHELHFYETSSGVRRAHDRGEFVMMSGNADYKLAAVSHPYVLPTTLTFVERLGAQYRSVCGEKLVVTSGTRPKSLRLANAADKSVHPTGMAVDLRRPTQARCLSWLRETLASLDAAGVIEATEERRPPHFHVAVFPTSYGRYVARQGGTVKVAARKESAAEADASSARQSAREAAAARTYKVRRGDSLWTIARRNSISVEDLKLANDLRSSRIKAGQVLRIPTAK